MWRIILGIYRKIAVKIWSDETFYELDPLEKLAWFAILTAPQLTPMGAGVFSPRYLEDIVWNDINCFCQNAKDCKHSGETLLDTFKDRLLILRDKGLVIVKNYLFYNRPDNPNILASWIESCEDLPRSNAFQELATHLQNAEPQLPLWLYETLLNPLARQENKTLKHKFYERLELSKRKVEGGVSGKLIDNVSGNPPRNSKQLAVSSKQLIKEKTLCDSDESHRGESSNAQNEITPPKRSPLRAWFEDVMWPAVPTIKKRGKEPTWAQVQKLKPDESTRAAIVTYFTSYYQIKRTYDQAQAKDKPHFPDMADPIRVIRDKRFLDALIPYKDPHAVVRPKRIYIIREDYEKAIARGENAEYRPPQGDRHV